jgi:hypothetical protein
MKIIGQLTIITATLLFVLCSIAAKQRNQFEPPTGPSSNASRVLELALKKDITGPEESIEELVAAVRDALKFLPEQSPMAEQLVSAIARLEQGGEAEDFVRSVKIVSSTLTFQPRKEAELPKGFPTYTPVGVVEVKEYPAYRMAVAGKFWTLFLHIQSNNIPMTTPVEMKYSANRSGKYSQQSMAFLYGKDGLGELGKKGKVNVVDVEPVTVVAIGVRGRRNQTSVDRAHQYLMQWIEAHPDHVASGSLRVMGYNSPMVRQADSFFEVQVPIREQSANISQ